MINVTIDCYGNRNDRESVHFNRISGEKFPHLIDAQTNVTYIAFAPADSGAQPIHKIVVSDNLTTIWWGYGTWANRASIVYDRTKNETRTIQVEE